MARWFAVMTKIRREQIAQHNLMFQGYNTFYPHYKVWSKPIRGKSRAVTKPYLPRYIFVGFNGEDCQSVYTVNNTIGVSTVVYSGVEPLEISEWIMTELMGRADDKGEIEVSDSREPLFKPGDKIRLAETNPLFGLIASIKRVDKNGRITILLEHMLGAEREAIISRADVGAFIRDEPPRPEGSTER